MGWLHAIPEQQISGNTVKWPHSRAEQILNQNEELPQVTLSYRENHVFQSFVDMGMVLSTAMGQQPLTWHEINAWQSINGGILTPADCTVVKEMSSAYMSSREEGKGMLSISPLDREIEKGDYDE